MTVPLMATFAALCLGLGATPAEADVLLERMRYKVPMDTPSRIMTELRMELDALREGR